MVKRNKIISLGMVLIIMVSTLAFPVLADEPPTPTNLVRTAGVNFTVTSSNEIPGQEKAASNNAAPYDGDWSHQTNGANGAVWYSGDSSTNKAWQPWYEYDLGQEYIITQVRIYTRWGQAEEQKRFRVVGYKESRDAAVELARQGDNQLTDKVWFDSGVLAELEAFRYIRYEKLPLTSGGSQWGYGSLLEFEVYGYPIPTVTPTATPNPTPTPTPTITPTALPTVTTTGCFESYLSDMANNKLTLRMKGLSASFTIDNTGGTAGNYTVTVNNVDPDYVTVSKGTVIDRRINSFDFSLDVPENNKVTVDIKPWYLNPNKFYFIAWSDNQDGPDNFKNKLLPKAALINPILSTNSGDVTYGMAPTVGGEAYTGQYPEKYKKISDGSLEDYLALLNDYSSPVFEVPGNHDMCRGGWVEKDDSNYGEAQSFWEKHLGPIHYGFDVGNTHFTMTNFHYDMKDWTQRWGGNISDAYFRLGTKGYMGNKPDGYTFGNDDDGDAIYDFLISDLGSAQTKTNRIAVSHHNFDMFIADYSTVNNARQVYASNKVNFMISGHNHTHSFSTDSATNIPMLVTGEASKSNPSFSLVSVNGSSITYQQIYAQNLNLNISYGGANDGTLTNSSASINCTGYSLPFVRLKFKMSNANDYYIAKDSATGEVIPTYAKKSEDYTVVYVEASVTDGIVKNITLEPTTEPYEDEIPEPEPKPTPVAVNLVRTLTYPAEFVAYSSNYAVDDPDDPEGLKPVKTNSNNLAPFNGKWDHQTAGSTGEVWYSGGKVGEVLDEWHPWYEYDLRKEYIITQIKLLPRWTIPNEQRQFRVVAYKDPKGEPVVLAEQGTEPLGDEVWFEKELDTPEAFRYIRYEKMPRDVGGILYDQGSLLEFEVWGHEVPDPEPEPEPELINVALNQTTIPSTNHNPEVGSEGNIYAPKDGIVDMYENTDWDNGGVNANIWYGYTGSGVYYEYDLGKEYDIRKIELLPRPNEGLGFVRRNFDIIGYKEDRGNGVLLASQGDDELAFQEWFVKDLSGTSNKYRYIRYQKTQGSMESYIQSGGIMEFRVWAVAPTQPKELIISKIGFVDSAGSDLTELNSAEYVGAVLTGKNDSDTAQKLSLVLCLYNDDVLSELVMSKRNFEIGEDIDIKIAIDTSGMDLEGYSARIFLWNGVDRMKPVGDNVKGIYYQIP